MKIPICVLCVICGSILLSGCAGKPEKKPDRPDVAPVRESFQTIDSLAAELESELKKSHR